MAVRLAFTVLAAGALTGALYVDQVGQYDRVERMIGPIRSVFLDSRQNHLLVATDAGVAASVNLSSGAARWRHVLPTDDELLAVAKSGSLLSVVVRPAGTREATLRLLGPANGVVVDEILLAAAIPEGSAIHLATSTAGDAVAVSVGSTVHTFFASSEGLRVAGSAVAAHSIFGVAYAHSQLWALSAQVVSGASDACKRVQFLRVLGDSAENVGKILKHEASSNVFRTSSLRLTPVSLLEGAEAALLVATPVGDSKHGLVVSLAQGMQVTPSLLSLEEVFQAASDIGPGISPSSVTAFEVLAPVLQSVASKTTTTPPGIVTLHLRLASGHDAVLAVRPSHVFGPSGASATTNVIDVSRLSQPQRIASIASDGGASIYEGGDRSSEVLSSWSALCLFVHPGQFSVGAALSSESDGLWSLQHVLAGTIGDEALLIVLPSLPGDTRASEPLKRIVGLDFRGAVQQGAVTHLPSPLSLGALTTVHGPVVRVFPVPPSDAAGQTLVWVHADGFVVSAQLTSDGARVLWARAEGNAHTVASVVVDISTVAWDTRADAAATAGEDFELSLAGRLASQRSHLAALASVWFSTATVTGILHSAAAAPTAAVDIIVQMLHSVTGSVQPSGKIRSGSAESLLPLHSHGDADTVVLRLSHSQRSKGPLEPLADVLGSVSASRFEDGSFLWSTPLPLRSPGHPSPVVDAISSRDYSASLHLSRPRPLKSAQPEILLVETIFDAAPAYAATLSWVDAATGRLVNQTRVRSSSPLESVSRLPLLHGGDNRDVFALAFAGSADLLVVPGDKSVRDVISSPEFAADFVMTSTEFDTVADVEALVGYTIDGASAALHATISGAVTVRRLQLWRQILAVDVSTPGTAGGERLLAFAAIPAAGTPAHTIAQPEQQQHTGADSMLLAASAASVDPSLVSGDGARSAAAHILGDDSLLLKYRNNNAALVVVGPSGPRESVFEAARRKLRDREIRRLRAPSMTGSPVAVREVSAPLSFVSGPAAAVLKPLTAYLIDLVSGRILYTRVHAGASGPVHAVKFDNWAVYTYWNARVARPELAVGTLWEGSLGTHDLTPWSKVRTALAKAPTEVSLFTQEPPVVIHRSFVLPVSVTDLTVTRTRYGVTTQHLLLSTVAEGVLMLDKRLVDPRRPAKEPTASETSEGLVQYSQVLPLRHTWLLTTTVAVARLAGLAATPTEYESTTLVTALGLDHFFARASPARAFDQLDPDFNAAAFTAVIAACGGAGLLLRRIVQGRDHAAAWK